MKFEKFKKESFYEKLKNYQTVDISVLDLEQNPIILDTNFLFIPFEFNLDLISEIERVVGKTYSLYIYEGTLGELNNIDIKKDKNKKYLSLILTMITKYNIKIISVNEKYIDNQILKQTPRSVLIATNDKELRKVLWSEQRKVLYLRQKKYLELK